MKNIIIIGGGILGLATARELLLRGHREVKVLEKEKQICLHQSSRNSGVMHSGLYYSPSSLKANLSRKGIKLLKKYCDLNHIDWEECGKIVVATNRNEIPNLEKLYSRGLKNKLIGLSKLNKNQVTKIEPYLKAEAGILVPEESIVSYTKVAHSYAREIESLGGKIIYNSKVIDYKEDSNNGKNLICLNGEQFNADVIIITSGLYNDKVAKLFNLELDNQQILPFRGEYFFLKPQFSYLVKNLIYPVPNPKLPFLGVHFTRMIDGTIEAGPNAVLALAREGYDWNTINMEELIESITYKGLQQFIPK